VKAVKLQFDNILTAAKYDTNFTAVICIRFAEFFFTKISSFNSS